MWHCVDVNDKKCHRVIGLVLLGVLDWMSSLGWARSVLLNSKKLK